MRTPRTNTSILLAAFAATALAFVGCEVIVGPDQLDTIHCNDEGHIGAPACPDNLQCNSGVCTAPKGTSGGAGGSGGQDASVGGTGGNAGGGGDAGTGGSGGVAGSSGSAGTSGTGGAGGTGGTAGTGGKDAGPTAKIGDDCTGDVAKCGTDLRCLPLPSNPKQSICTTLCCGVSQCNPSGSSNNRYLCAPYGTNGTYSTENVCLPVNEVIPGEHSVNTAKLGTPCSRDLDCASGLCTKSADGKDSFCTEACCSNTGGSPDCLGGTFLMGCSLSSHMIGESTVPMPLCKSSQGKFNKKSSFNVCGADDKCVSNICMSYGTPDKPIGYCNSLCCSDEQCKADNLPGDSVCEYVLDTKRSKGRPVRECVQVIGNKRASPMTPCCNDLNCDTKSGYRCREVPTPVFYLDDSGSLYDLKPTTTNYPVYRCTNK